MIEYLHINREFQFEIGTKFKKHVGKLYTIINNYVYLYGRGMVLLLYRVAPESLPTLQSKPNTKA